MVTKKVHFILEFLHYLQVCDAEFTKGQNRDHVCWHFMDELRDLVLSFPDTKMCNECSYTSDKLDNLVKHVALGKKNAYFTLNTGCFRAVLPSAG